MQDRIQPAYRAPLRLVGTGGFSRFFRVGNSHLGVKAMKPYSEMVDLVREFTAEETMVALNKLTQWEWENMAHMKGALHVIQAIRRRVVDDIELFEMPCYSGGTLLDWINRLGKVKLSENYSMFLALLKGLKEFDEREMVQIDLKPQNIILASRGLIHIDLSFITPVGKRQKTISPDCFMGTPYCMSPEIALSQPLQAETHCYLAGLILYMVLSRRAPFSHIGNLEGVIAAQVSQDLDLESLRRKGFPEEVVSLIGRLTAKKMEHRASLDEAERIVRNQMRKPSARTLVHYSSSE